MSENMEETKEKIEDTSEINTDLSQKIQEELDETTDRLKRIMAEFENFKKRSAKERESLYDSILGYWYRGTADAIYQNLDFLKSSHEPYVLVASGDGVYKMDFNKVLEYHIERRADITVVCRDMSPSANLERFGTIRMNEESRVEEFEEKPLHAKSRVISCGIPHDPGGQSLARFPGRGLVQPRQPAGGGLPVRPVPGAGRHGL